MRIKFWLTQKLEAHEKIDDGFYDVGVGRIHQATFPTITQIRHQQPPCKKIGYIFNSAADPDLRHLLDTTRASLHHPNPYDDEKVHDPLRSYLAHIALAVVGHIQYEPNIHTMTKYLQRLSSDQQGDPILSMGKLRFGTTYHRAFLFKYLCDQMGNESDVKVSLQRNEYGRAWNIVKRIEGWSVKEYVIDLHHRTGMLLAVESRDGAEYIGNCY